MKVFSDTYADGNAAHEQDILILEGNLSTGARNVLHQSVTWL